jgi:hypothetical protein
LALVCDRCFGKPQSIHLVAGDRGVDVAHHETGLHEREQRIDQELPAALDFGEEEGLARGRFHDACPQLLAVHRPEQHAARLPPGGCKAAS